MSPLVAPGRIAAMPRIIASCVTSISRSARRGISPIVNMRLELPCQPSRMRVTSILTMSPSLSGLSPGNAVANHVIERGAGRLLVAAIHERRGQGAMIHRIFEDQPVDFLSRHARSDMFRQHVQTARNQLPGFAHGFECGGAVDLDLAGLADWGDGGVDVGHDRQCKVCSVRCKRAFVNALGGNLPPSSSSIWARTMSSNAASALNPRSRARLASICSAHPDTICRTQLVRCPADARGHLIAATRRSASICSPTVQDTPGIARLTRGPTCSRVRPAAWMSKS